MLKILGGEPCHLTELYGGIMEIRRFMRHLLSDSKPDHKIPGKQMARGLPLLKISFSLALSVGATAPDNQKSRYPYQQPVYCGSTPVGACPAPSAC